LETGVALKQLPIHNLRKVSLLVPPIDLQHRFATIVESVERQKTRLRTHLAELDTLFASLQSRAFNGEL
jgi:type I restriction enzyme S subunit